MNKIFKVIWSKARNCYVVVSEIVNGNGKNKSHKKGRRNHLLVSGVTALLGIGISFIAPVMTEAAIDIGYAGFVTDPRYANQYSYVWYPSVNGSALYNYHNPNNPGIGLTENNYKADPIQGIAIGKSANADDNVTGGTKTNSGIALGDYTVATGGLATAIGGWSQATGVSSMALGPASMASGFNALSMMRQSVARGDFSSAIGVVSSALGKGSLAVGYSSLASGDQSIAIGSANPKITSHGPGSSDSAEYVEDVSQTRASGARSIALGTGSRTEQKAPDSVAIGSRAISSGDGSVSIGKEAASGGDSAIALGSGAKASHGRDIAIGTNVSAVGANNGTNMEVPSIAMGYDTHVDADESAAIGNKNTVSGKDKNGNTLTGVNIQGHNNIVNASGVQVVGNNNKVTDKNFDDVFILGNQITAGTNNSVYLGSGSAYMPESDGTKGNSKNYNSDAVGGKTMNFAGGALTAGVVTVGSSAATRRIQGVAPGFLSASSTDAVNGSQLYAAVNALAGNAPHYYSVANPSESDQNYNNDGAKGMNALAAGKGTLAYGENSTAVGRNAQTGNANPSTGNAANATALGNNAKAYSSKSVAVGDGAIAGNQWNAGQGMNTIAVGPFAQATAKNSVSLGNGTQAQSISSVVIGDGASTTTSTGESNTVIGTRASSAGGANNIVMGTQASNGANTGNAVILGYGAKTVSGAAANAIAIGTSSKVDGGGMAIGNGAHVTNSSATNGGSIAIGDMSEVSSAGGGIAIGKEAKSTNSTGPEGGAIALGQKAVSNGVQSMAIGYNAHNREAQTGQIALGANAATYGENSIAIGRDAKTEDNNSGQLALGYNAAVKYGGGIALGSNSVANRTKDVPDAYNPYRANDSGVAATKATTSALSIGSDGGGGTTKVLRQITNVAAGGADTDAVNVAQLKAVAADISASSSQNFTVGADSSHSTNGVNVTKDNNRFDITSKDEYYLTTGVSSDKKGIEIGLTDAAKSAIQQVSANTANIADNTGKIKTNTSAISNLTATVENGLNFKGDNNIPIHKKLGDTLSVKGGVSDASALTSGNIGVVSDADGALNVKLSKTLTGLTGVTTGGTTMSDGGITVKGSAADGSQDVKITSSGLANGGNKITGVKSGIDGAKDASGDTATVATAVGDTLNNAANIGDVQSAMADISWKAQQNGAAAGTVKNGGTVNFANGAATTAAVTTEANGIKVVYDLSDSSKQSLNNADSALQSFQTSVNGTAAQTVDKTQNKANFIQGDNILLTGSADGIKIATSSTPAFSSVTSGAININGSDGLSTILSTIESGDKSALSVGGSKIANVADGTEAKDAVNRSQLDAAKTRFYSANSTTSADGNYDNNGATGIDALAAGIGASATGANASAVGHSVLASGANAAAFGNGAQAKGISSTAIGDGAIANGEMPLLSAKVPGRRKQKASLAASPLVRELQ